MTKTLIFLLATTSLAFGDQVTMKNGDKLTGTIIKSDGKKLTMKTEFAGEVTIDYTSITALTTSDAVQVGIKDGQVAVGPVSTSSDGKLQVATSSAGTVTAARDSVVYVRSKAEQAAYEKEEARLRNPRLVDLWTGFLDMGFAQSQGNANTRTFTLNTNASRATSRDKMSVYYTSIFSTSDASGKSLTTANAKRGGIGYNLNLSKRTYAFGSVDLENDQFQSLDLRFSPAGGGGIHAVKRENTTFDVFFGGSLNREFFTTGLTRTSGELITGEEFMHKLSANSTLREKLSFLPNLSQSGNYRMNFDTSMITAVRKWLAWQVSFSDRYLSNPVAGRKSNDILFTTGVRLTFAK